MRWCSRLLRRWRPSLVVGIGKSVIHERISPAAILDNLRTAPVQRSLFGDPEFDLNQAVEFYQHQMPWVNRLVPGKQIIRDC